MNFEDFPQPLIPFSSTRALPSRFSDGYPFSFKEGPKLKKQKLLNYLSICAIFLNIFWVAFKNLTMTSCVKFLRIVKPEDSFWKDIFLHKVLNYMTHLTSSIFRLKFSWKNIEEKVRQWRALFWIDKVTFRVRNKI